MSKPIGLDFNNRITYLESNKADKTIKILDITDLVNLSSRDYTTYIIGSILPTNSPPGGTAWSLLEYIPINIDYAKLVWTNFGSAIETRGKSFEAVLDITNKIFLYAWKPIIKKEDLEQITDKGYVDRITKSTLDECNENGKYTVVLSGVAGFVNGTYCVDVTKYSSIIYVQRIYRVNPSIDSYIRVVNGSDIVLGKIATTGKIEISFPFNSGYVIGSSTWKSKVVKNSLDEVKYYVNCKPSTSNFVEGATIIGTIPTGYRPTETIGIPLRTASLDTGTAMLTLDSNGIVTVLIKGQVSLVTGIITYDTDK